MADNYPAPTETDPDEDVESEHLHPHRKLIVIVVVVVLALVAVGIWWHSTYSEDTDDAQVNGHLIQVSSRISGQVLKVDVDENQVVKAGDVIVEFAGKAVATPQELQTIVEQAHSGQEYVVQVLRDGKRTDLKVNPAESHSDGNAQGGSQTKAR